MGFKHKLNEALNKSSIKEAIQRRIPQELRMPSGLSPEEEKDWKKKQRAYFKEEDQKAKELVKRIATKIPPGGNAQDLALALGLIPKGAGTKAIRKPDKERGQPVALTDIPWEEVSAFAESFPTYIAEHPEISDGKVIITVKNRHIDLTGKRTKKGDTDIPAQMASVRNMRSKGVEKYGAVNFVRRVLKSYGADWQEFQRGNVDVSKRYGKTEPLTVFSIDIKDAPIDMENKDDSMESPSKATTKASKMDASNAEASQLITDLLGDMDVDYDIDVDDLPDQEDKPKKKKSKEKAEKPEISKDEQDFMDDLFGDI